MSAPYTITLTPGVMPKSFKLNPGNSTSSLLLSDFGGVWFEAALMLPSLTDGWMLFGIDFEVI